MKTKKYLCIWQASQPSQTVKHRLASFTLQIIGKPYPSEKNPLRLLIKYDYLVSNCYNARFWGTSVAAGHRQVDLTRTQQPSG